MDVVAVAVARGCPGVPRDLVRLQLRVEPGYLQVGILLFAQPAGGGTALSLRT